MRSAHMFDSLLQHCWNNPRLKREETREAFAIAANHLIPLNERHAQEWRDLKASLSRYPPPKKAKWAFSWQRERQAMGIVLPRLLVRGAILALLLWGAFAWWHSANAPGQNGWIKAAYYLLLIACLDQAKMVGMAGWLQDGVDGATPITHRVLSPLGCIGMLIPVSLLWFAAQAVGLLIVLNFAYKATLFIIGKREAAKRDYSEQISDLLMGM